MCCSPVARLSRSTAPRRHVSYCTGLLSETRGGDGGIGRQAVNAEQSGDGQQQGAGQPASAAPRGDWRNWLLSATARAGVATGFLLTPTVREQLGDVAVAALSVFISAALVGTLAGHWYVARRGTRRDLAADAFAVLALVPAAIVAAGIQGADDRFGGRTVYVLAALAATTLTFAIVALIARMDERIEFGQAALGALGGALSLAALIGNPHRYSTADSWQPLSLAWIVAALATLLFSVLPTAARSAFPLVVYALFALAAILWPVDRATQQGGADTLSVLTLIIAGAAMVLIAPSSQRR